MDRNNDFCTKLALHIVDACSITKNIKNIVRRSVCGIPFLLDAFTYSTVSQWGRAIYAIIHCLG